MGSSRKDRNENIPSQGKIGEKAQRGISMHSQGGIQCDWSSWEKWLVKRG